MAPSIDNTQAWCICLQRQATITLLAIRRVQGVCSFARPSRSSYVHCSAVASQSPRPKRFATIKYRLRGTGTAQRIQRLRAADVATEVAI